MKNPCKIIKEMLKQVPLLSMIILNRHSERAVIIFVTQAWNPYKDVIETLKRVQDD